MYLCWSRMRHQAHSQKTIVEKVALLYCLEEKIWERNENGKIICILLLNCRAVQIESSGISTSSRTNTICFKHNFDSAVASSYFGISQYPTLKSCKQNNIYSKVFLVFAFKKTHTFLKRFPELPCTPIDQAVAVYS